MPERQTRKLSGAGDSLAALPKTPPGDVWPVPTANIDHDRVPVVQVGYNLSLADKVLGATTEIVALGALPACTGLAPEREVAGQHLRPRLPLPNFASTCIVRDPPLHTVNGLPTRRQSYSAEGDG